MTATMKAARLVDGELVIQELPVPEPGAGRRSCASARRVCHSDLHSGAAAGRACGRRSDRHEAIGVVEASAPARSNPCRSATGILGSAAQEVAIGAARAGGASPDSPGTARRARESWARSPSTSRCSHRAW